jgi:hypothetical protein
VIDVFALPGLAWNGWGAEPDDGVGGVTVVDDAALRIALLPFGIVLSRPTTAPIACAAGLRLTRLRMPGDGFARFGVSDRFCKAVFVAIRDARLDASASVSPLIDRNAEVDGIAACGFVRLRHRSAARRF